ncbi:thioredoxin family protein [Dyella sp. ASV21]|uniref:thioredoxin family protein n=1 Tax=Dyella sp. ASV21 TaxID=2795114 RepID=UPI0018EADFD3|nr:thioredoxin family protein [Dyella sp. ASV21]
MHIPAPTRRLALALSLALLSPVLAHAADEHEPTTIADALKASAQQHRPVLVDFQAGWCYSCYYMASHVLTGPEWESVKRKAIVVEADADSPEAQTWMKKLNASFLPSYVVLDANGNELGRIAAEQPRDKFYPRINAILAHGDTLEAFERRAQKGSLDDIANALEAYQARNDGEAGLSWFATLPANTQQTARTHARVALALDQLALAKAQAANDNPAVVRTAQKVLAQDIGCLRPYVVDSLLEASEKLPSAERKALLAPQRAALTTYVDSQVLVANPACADQRSAVIASADLARALGDTAAENAVLDRAIQLTHQRLGNNLASDRNLADNLRVYLIRAGRKDELDAYQRKLIAAYPNDYVYAYRYGRSLVEAGKAADALPYLSKAADKAYGANRLSVALQQVRALKALHRTADAKQLVTDVLDANGPWFPKQAAALSAELKS